MVFNNADAIERLKKGYYIEELTPHNKPKLYADGYFEQFAPKNYQIAPSNPKPIEDGFIIDLGDRKIKVIHTPGHSPDSIMLFDMDNKALFTGDSYYPGHLYTHYEGTFYGESNIDTYAKTMEKIALMAKDLISIHPGHNQPLCDPLILEKVAIALRALNDGRIQNKRHLFGDLSIASLPDNGEEVEGYVVPDDLYVYEFDGIKIIARDHSFPTSSK
jgi:glyoxylase-like metal-dependent hydrolase (beta-lactamase superfamily II)